MKKKVEKRKAITFTAIIVVIIGLTGKIFGFLRELLLARYFGTSRIVDIYLMSITIPSILFGFLPALSVGFTPVYYSIKAEVRNKFLNNILSFSIVIAFACILFTLLFADNIVHIVANGFDEGAQAQTRQFLMITMWSVLFNTPIQILASYLNCKSSYISSNIANLTISLIQALFVVVAAKINVLLLAYGYLLPFIVQFLWLFGSACRKEFRPKPTLKFDQNIKKIIILVIPIFISNMLVDLNGFVDKYLGASLPEGRISALNYSFTLRSVFYTVCTTVVTTIFYPKISELAAEKKDDELSSIAVKVIDILLVLFIPLQLFCIIFSRDIIKIVLMRGNFSQSSLELTVDPFIMYMLSLLFISITDLIVKIFYAKGDSIHNLLYGGINIGINISISICLVNFLGHTGLALGTTLSAVITFPLYLRRLSKDVNGLRLKSSLIKAGKIMLASSCIGLFLIIFTKHINIMTGDYGTATLMIRLALQFVCSSVIYIAFLKMLKVEEANYLCRFFMSKYKKL